MAPRLFQMLLEHLGELLMRRRLCHLWESLCELDFGAVEILQCVNERVMECVDFHNRVLSFSTRTEAGSPPSLIALNEG